MIDRKFGRLTVLSCDEKASKQNKRDCYLCHCDCDKEKVIRGLHLRNGSIKSCGCLSREKSRETCRKLNKRQIGENHPACYSGLYCKELHEKVRRKAGYKCQQCGKTQEENGQKLSVHHLDGNHYNDNSENTEALCKTCHRVLENKLRKKS